MQKKVMLVDGNSIVNRAYYGVPLLSNAEGKYTNAVYGFFNILFKLIDEDKPDYLGIAFDLKAPTFRHQKFDGYKGTRKGMPEELVQQMPMLKELLTELKIKQYAVEGFEADDILGTLSKKAEDMGFEAVVVSGDRDLLQLASNTLKIRIPKTKGGKTEVEDYYEKDVVEKYGVTPTEFIDLKALIGDASDNIPGVPGIGEKTATKIIAEYKNIEAAIENAENVKPPRASKNLQEFQEQARLSKFLATIVRDMPIELDPDEMPIIGSQISPQAYELIKRYEFKSMINRFSVEEEIKKPESKEKSTYKLIVSKIEFNEYISSIEKGTDTAYVIFAEDGKLKALSLYNEGVGGCLAYITESLSTEAVADIARDFFGNTEYIKIGHNIKSDISLMRSMSVNLDGVTFDTAIAAYILNPTRETYHCDDIASEFLNQTIKSEEEVLGKGKSKKSIVDIKDDELLEFAAPQAQIVFKSKKVMEQRLKENGQVSLFYDIEMPLIFVLSDMEKWGMKVNRKELIEYQKNLERELESLTTEIYFLAGEEFNINSPKQLGVILFEKLGLKGSKKTKTGYSTAAEVLEKLRLESPVVEKILLYRQLSKLKSTYADGLLNVMDEKTEKIYSTFNQTITATGRISSTEPNLQNIPIRLELGRKLRKVFIPSSDEYVFLDADYSQIELRVLADMANDETLINAFKEGQDIHRLTASQVFNIPFDEVTSQQRSNAKAVNFGIVYGIGAFSLGQDLGISRKEAEQYIESYFEKYPNIRVYMDKTIENARANGYVATIFGRRRAMPELNASNFVQRSFGERVAMNMPIQGSAADIIKIAMVKVHNEIKKRGLKSRLILQVHDELLIETHINEIEEVSALLKDNMENAVSLKVPMEAEVKMGKSWYETK
ncbi:MAG TPA: DNA polymerase I [Lachnospiraceae bacterium]|nr:DNA polymerase I [Lachnospiraceae bacterium]